MVQATMPQKQAADFSASSPSKTKHFTYKKCIGSDETPLNLLDVSVSIGQKCQS